MFGVTKAAARGRYRRREPRFVTDRREKTSEVFRVIRDYFWRVTMLKKNNKIHVEPVSLRLFNYTSYFPFFVLLG